MLRFLQGKTSPEENQEIQQWLEESDENTNFFLKIKGLWKEKKHPQHISEEEIAAEWEKVSAYLMEQAKPKAHFIKRALQMAAVILIILGFTSVIYLHLGDKKREMQYVTNIGEKRKIMLNDGSAVWMNASTTLTVRKHFGQKNRHVELNGEAWFDIARDENVPFIVSAAEVDITVLGTQFNVNAYDWGGAIVTTLEEGAICFTSEAVAEAVYLNPGEMGTFEKEKHTITISQADAPQFSSWRENVLYFNETPLDVVLKRIENHYGVHIQGDVSVLGNDKITLTINNEPLEEALNLLTLITNHKFTAKNKIIEIDE